MHEIKINRIIININNISTIGMCTSLVYIGEKLEKVVNVQLISEYKRC